jgi:hypothetical protein
VDEDVDISESVKCVCGQRGNSVDGADVGGDDVVGRPVRDGPRCHDDPCAAGTQPVGDALSDAAGTARDQSGTAYEFVGVRHAASLALPTDIERSAPTISPQFRG